MIERITDIEGVDIEWIGEAPIEPKLEALAEEKLPGTAISRALDPIENEWLKTMELEGIPTGGPLRGEKEFRGIPALAPFVGGVGKPRPEMTSDMWEEVAKREMKGAIEGLAAVGEVPTTILTGLAGFVGGGVSSGASLVQSGLANLFGADVSMKEALEESIKAGEETAGMMTWQPRTKLAQEAVEVAMTPIHWVVDKVRGFGNFLIDKGIPIIDENATPQQIVDELEAWNRGERRMNPAMVTAITTPLELYAIGKMLSKAHGAAKSIGKDLYPTLPKPTDIGISRRELNKIDKQILAELMEKKPPPEPPPEPPGPPGGIARTPEELSRLKEPLEKSPIGSSAESLMETVVEEPKVEIKTDALSGEKIVTVEEVPKTRAEVRKARAKKKVVDEDEGVPGVKSLEEPPAPVAGEVIEEPIPSKPDLKIVPKKEKAPIEEHYPSAEEIGVEGVADALQEVNKSLSRAEAIKQAEGIVAYKTKPVGGEAPTMSKAEWEDKYSIGDYEYHQGKLPLINLKTRPGQLRALEFIRSVTKDPLEQIVKDEMLSMMRENIFTYEEAVKAGKVRMPTAKEAPSAPELFDSTTTGTPHWDGLLKKGEAKIVRMTPDEYLEQQAKAKGTYPEDVSQYVLDETVVEYVERMKKGEKAPLPLIDWVEKTQEGRARVLAAKKLGQKEIPVLVREKVPKAIPPERLIDQISRLYDEGKSVEEIAKKLVMEEEAVLDRLAYLEKSRAKNVVTLEEIEPEIKEALNSAEGNLETAYNNLRKLVDKYEESFDYAFTNEGELGAFRLRTDEVLGGILEKMRKDGIVPTPDVEGKVESFPYDDPTRQGGFTTRGAAERYADSFDIEGEIIENSDVPGRFVFKKGPTDVDIGFGGYEMWGKAYRDFVNKMKSRSEKTGEKISEKGTEILDKGEIVQRRQIQGMLRPPIYKAEHEVVKGAKTLDENQYWGRAFQNPIYTFKEAGGEAMLDLTIHPYNDRVWAATWMKKKIGKTRKELFNSVSRGDRKKIGIYAINKQKRGPRLLANSGVEKGTIAKAIQDVESNPKLIEAYNKLRDRYESWYTRLNRVRQAIGKKPFPKEDDYFTFIRTLSMMERMGFKPMQTGTDLFTSQYAKAGATPFRFAKRRRGGKYRAELDPFRVLETYENVAIDHVQLSPLIAKLRELQASIKDPDTGKTYNLANSNPVLAKALHEWTNHIAGMKSPKWQISPGAEAVLLRVNNNLVASILGANVRSALIQPMALKNTMSRIGFTYTARGIASLLWDAPNTFREVGGIVARGEPMSRGPAMRTSKTLLPRVFETVQADVIDSIIRGQGKKWLTKQSLKPLQILDYITAKATYNGAYDYAIKELGYSAKKAVTFADDTVVTTQASALPGHIAPIQRSVAGRTLTLFQTFVINDWNFLMRHVLGKSNVDISNAQAFTRTMRWVAAATLFNILYEDILGINSPLPTPIKSFKESLEKGDSLPSLAWNVGKEFIEPVPIIGSARYGKGPGGPVAELAQETIKHVASQPSTKSGTEVLGSWLGIPGTQQWAKIGRARKRGETPYGQVVGTYTPKKKSRRTRGGFGGMGGGMGGL